MARELGFGLRERLDVKVGPEIRRFYKEAGALGRYQEERGRPAAYALLFVKETV